MSTVIFKTEEAIFQFDRKSVMELLDRKNSSYDVQELDTLIDILSNQPERTVLSSAEHQHFGLIVLKLINTSDGSVICKNCGKQYRFNQLEAFTVGPDDATFKAATAKKVGLKRLFRKRLKLPNLYGGEGFKCPEGHILIYMQTWTS